MFVVLVTNAIFDEDNYITKEILPFCKENHKPVLPILCEKCNPDIFNDVFSNMQYIDPFSQDATGLSYDQKLKTYLETVLVSDELAQKIRDAFDAYVFLSYRKKDREYAQKLMRLIHSNPSCRDIAIWYDEFLVPGRSFSDSIKDAFNKTCSAEYQEKMV